MTRSYHLSPEVLEEIFIHTLDYSYQLNNLQLKRLQRVSKVFCGVATRLLYRWILVSKEWTADQLYRTLIAKRDLRTLVRSIFFLGNASLDPAQEMKLLALLPLCTTFHIDTNQTITIGSGESYTPTYPTNERLAVVRAPHIYRKPLSRSPSPRRPLPGSAPGNPNFRAPPPPNFTALPIYESEASIPLIKPNSSLDYLASLPEDLQHLVISGSDVKDFEGDDEDTVIQKFPLKKLVSLELSKISIGWRQMWEIMEQSLKSKTLKSLRCRQLEIDVHVVVLDLAALFGSSLRELVLYTYKPSGPIRTNQVDLASMLKLESLAITEYSKDISWNQLPPNLRDLSIYKYNHRFGRSEIATLILALEERGFPNLDSFSIAGERPAVPPRRSFPRTTIIRHDPIFSSRRPGLRRLRIEGLRLDGTALDSLIQFCAPTLRYLALLDIDILVPWAAVAKCRSLRWIGIGGLDRYFDDWEDSDSDSDDSDEESEDDDKKQKNLQDAPYDIRRRKAQVFLDTTFPHLDYLHLHLGDSFSLSDVVNSIKRNRWPAIKVIDLDGLQKGGLYEDEDIEEENAKGLEELFEMSKSRGITICARGTPLQGLGDLWRYMLNRKSWGYTGSDDDMY